MRRTPAAAAATAAMAAAALLLSACSTGEDPGASVDSSPAPAVGDASTPEPGAEPGVDEDARPEPTEDEQPAAAAEVPAALDFTTATVDGGTFDGSTLLGQDAVLYFWAPWCTICRREAPALPGIAAEFAGEATFYGVAGLSPDVSAMQGFVADTGTESLTHLADTEGTIYSGFGVSSQTTFGFVDEDGSIEIVPGPLSDDEIRERTQALVES